MAWLFVADLTFARDLGFVLLGRTLATGPRSLDSSLHPSVHCRYLLRLTATAFDVSLHLLFASGSFQEPKQMS